jgi:hypothetical protein
MLSKSFFVIAGILTVLLAAAGAYIVGLETGGPCNAGILMLGLDIVLFTAALPFFLGVSSFAGKKPVNAASKIILIAALLVWSLACVFIIPQSPLNASLFFLPFLLTIVLAVLRAFSRRDAH